MVVKSRDFEVNSYKKEKTSQNPPKSFNTFPLTNSVCIRLLTLHISSVGSWHGKPNRCE